MAEYDVKHDGWDVMVQVMMAQKKMKEREKEHTFTKMRLRGFDKTPFKYVIHEEEEDGLVVSDVMFFNITRSHASIIGRVLHSAHHWRPNYGLLFFKLIPLLYQYC